MRKLIFVECVYPTFEPLTYVTMSNFLFHLVCSRERARQLRWRRALQQDDTFTYTTAALRFVLGREVARANQMVSGFSITRRAD